MQLKNKQTNATITIYDGVYYKGIGKLGPPIWMNFRKNSEGAMGEGSFPIPIKF